MRKTEKWFKETLKETMTVMFHDCMDDVAIENCIDDIAKNFNFDCTVCEFVETIRIKSMIDVITENIKAYLPTNRFEGFEVLDFYTTLFETWNKTRI
mgnify:CR=1 FL=1